MSDSYEQLQRRLYLAEKALERQRTLSTLHFRLHDYRLIPEACMAAIQRHIGEGSETGSFVHAVLCNDLREAVVQADDTNIWLLPVYVHWLYNHAPAGSWGSAERVKAWKAARQEEAEARADQPERSCGYES